jgi:hypothetical protein
MWNLTKMHNNCSLILQEKVKLGVITVNGMIILKWVFNGKRMWHVVTQLRVKD